MLKNIRQLFIKNEFSFNYLLKFKNLIKKYERGLIMYEDKKNYLFKSGIFGLVVADALGVPYEFKDRHFCQKHPMIDMVGYGTYNLPPGTWSDDSSLALATVDGLTYSLNSNKDKIGDEGSDIDILGIIDYADIMQKFCNWFYDAEYTPHRDVFDYGGTTANGIYKFKSGCEPILSGGNEGHDNGNGSLMRILPIAYFIYFLSKKYSFSKEDKMNAIHNLSSLTHRHERSQMACGIYVLIAIELLKNRFEEDNELGLEELVGNGIQLAKEYYCNNDDFQKQLEHFDRILNEDIKDIPIEIIRGRGYVVASLEASLWCLLNNDSYKETALAAVNLGEDTDTTAAIAGGLAGIYYGYDDIPQDWLKKIARFDYVDELIDDFADSL